NLFEKREWNTELVTNVNERSDVFWKARTAVTDSGVKKLPPDPAVHSNSICNLFHISAAGVADRGNGVDIRNLQSQERIGRVFDEFGAVDPGDKHRRHERFVNFFQQVDRMLTLRADDDAVRVHQIVNGA